MPIRSHFFGLLKMARCDRCGANERSIYNGFALCKECFDRDPATLREESFVDSWEQTRAGHRHVSCSLCGYTGLPRDFRYSCIDCRSRHPDGTHEGLWGYAPHGYGETDVEHCWWCCGALVKSRASAGTTSRTYWRVGSETPLSEPYVCSRDRDRVRAIQRECEHQYVELFSNARQPEEADAARRRLSANPAIVTMMSRDMAGLPHNLAYASEGSTHFWCWRCGYCLDLNPSRYYLLPKVGCRD
jgi:hypothetical protein